MTRLLALFAVLTAGFLAVQPAAAQSIAQLAEQDLFARECVSSSYARRNWPGNY